MKLSQTIELIQNSPSSIFTKQDVLDLVSKIQVSEIVEITQEQIEEIAEDIADRVNRNIDDIVSVESVTVSYGSYGGVDDVCYDVDDNQIAEIVQSILVQKFTPAEPVSTSPENNPAENQSVTNSL